MTQLQRWLDSGCAPGDALELLQQARPPVALDPVTQARSRHRLVVMTTIPAAASLMFWLKSVALGAVIGSAVTAAIVVPDWHAQPAASSVPASRSTQPAQPAPAQRTPENAVAKSEPEAPVLPSAAPRDADELWSSASPKDHAAGVPAPSTTKATPTTAVNGADDLGREIQLLERARQLLNVSPKRALSTLAQHKAEFGKGTLGLERQFLEIEALVRLGRLDEARSRAAALRARAPGSLYEHRLSQLLDGEND